MHEIFIVCILKYFLTKEEEEEHAVYEKKEIVKLIVKMKDFLGFLFESSHMFVFPLKQKTMLGFFRRG